jgi:Ca2+-binding RTX toxin-like protein
MRRAATAALAGVGVAALVWAAVALADVIDCGGGGKKCNGTEFDDEITGSSKKDVINAKDGFDEVYAGRGNDAIDGGDYIDFVEGGKGDDLVTGNDGDDQGIIGGLFGDKGDDTVQGNAGDDDLYGGSGKDGLVGGQGNDQLVGARAGTAGPDGAKDVLSCGPGFDVAIYDGKDKVDNDCEDQVPETRR